MGFLSDISAETGIPQVDPSDPAGIGGGAGARASIAAAEIQAESGREAIEFERQARARAQGFFEPFAGVAERGLKGAGFLADPQAQFDFLQQNPLFQAALENANVQTQQQAASRGRSSAGDTLQQLSQNVLLSAQPLIDRQRQDVSGLLGLGTDITTSQANVAIGESANVGGLLTDIGAAQAAGGVGAANARAQGGQNIATLAGTAIGAIKAFSDSRLKKNIKSEGIENGHNIYLWDWNDLAAMFGLVGSSFGVLADEVKITNPEAVSTKDGYMMVNYGMIGVRHGS